MTKNPFVNAAGATLYIILVASLVFNGQRLFGNGKSVLIPIAMLSLFTLSAAVMGYIFLYQPAQMYLDGKKKVALNLFLQTLATFAGITVLVFLLLFLGILR